MRIARAMLMTEPASIDGNELTDKGYINQRAGLERRAALVERLYAERPGRRGDYAELIAIVGWVERSETHQPQTKALMGIASLHPSYEQKSNTP